MPLNDMLCRTAKTQIKRYRLLDSDGLILDVMPTGSKFWRIRYRYLNVEKLITIGKYPQVSLQQARKERNEIKEMVRTGINPIAKRIDDKRLAIIESANNLELLAAEWFEKNKPSWKPRYASTVMHRLEKYVFPTLGKIPLSEMQSHQVLTCLLKIDKTAPEMARRVKNIISHLFKYACVTQRAKADITVGLEIALTKYKKKHYASIDLQDLPKFLLKFHNHKARLYNQTYLAIKLMMLTFVRTSELIDARWSEIDFLNAQWSIPAERMKMGLPHIVPLSKQALAIFSELYEMNGKREHVFPSIPRPRKPMSKGTILVALKRMGYSGIMTGHGFRALALGVLKEKLNYSHEIADRQLAHVPRSSVDRAYDRAKFLPQRTIMMQDYADYLDSILSGQLLQSCFASSKRFSDGISPHLQINGDKLKANAGDTMFVAA